MRTLGATTQTNQPTLNRQPLTKMVLRDMRLRFSDFVTTAYNNGYPSTADDDGIPQIPLDMDKHSDGSIWRTWSASTTVYIHKCVDPSDTSSWGVDTAWLRSTDSHHRPSVIGNIVFFADSGDIYQSTNGGSPTVFKSSAYTPAVTSHIALAAVSENAVYVLEYYAVFAPTGKFKYLQLHRHTATTVETCPHTIVVNDDYVPAALTWFDAETFGDKDIIILNEKLHGYPVCITYEDGVWTQARPILPQDIVDNYTYLRLGMLTVIDDHRGEPVLWATGRRGFGGSTGANAQNYDVAVRSKDGMIWSIDRYSYMCENDMRSKLLVPGDGYVYYSAGDSVKQARQPYLLGNDHEDLKLELESDILGWTFDQPQPGTACKGTVRVADHYGTYRLNVFDETDLRFLTNEGDLALHPGMWLWRYAGYGEADTLMAVEILDRLDPSYRAGDRSLVVTTRDSVMRLLKDWRSAQDWQWLSQQKHHDDCDQMDYLYSIGAAMIEVRDEINYSIDSNVDEEELEEATHGLRFQTYNKPGIFLSTKPFDARNFQVRGRFQFAHENSSEDPGGMGSFLSLGSEMGALSTPGPDVFEDLGRDFTPWGPNCPGCALVSSCSQDKYKYIITVKTSNGTIHRGYIGCTVSGNTSRITVHPNETGSTTGWINDEGPIGYPVSYHISHKWQWLGNGFGAIGCVADQYNLVAAFFCANDHKLYLLRRTGDEDYNYWHILGETDYWFDPGFIKKHRVIDVRLIRNGRRLVAEAWVYDHPTATVHYIDSITYDWDLADKMIPGRDDDHCKVGVMTNITVPETYIERVRISHDHLSRQAGMWGWPVMECTWVEDDFGWFSEGASAPPLHLGSEEFILAKRTYSNRKAFYHMLAEKAGGTTPGMESQVFFSNTELGNPPIPDDWTDDGMGYGWIFAVTDGGGVGVSARVIDTGLDLGPRHCYFRTGETVTWEGNYYYIAPEEFDELVAEDEVIVPSGGSWHDMSISFFHILPGFYIQRPDGGRRAYSGQAGVYPLGSKVQQHDNDHIIIREVWAYDDEMDKNLEHVLKDIAAKAGILDFETYQSVDYTLDPIEGHESIANEEDRWIQDRNGNWLYTRDFDITINLDDDTPPMGADRNIYLLCRASSRYTEDLLYDDLYDFSAIRIYVTINSYGNYAIDLHQTNSETDSWVHVDHISGQCETGERIRFVGRENYFSVYCNDRWLGTLCAGPIYRIDADGYSASFESAGYVGMYSNMSSDWSAHITQPELWTWTDGKILDQRMNAVSGLTRVIGDRRIKFQATQDGKLKLSTFEIKDDLGAFNDPIYQDNEGPTDAIPTHIRAVGAEVSDYINHAVAAMYGLTFDLTNTPSLDEQEAYAEAQRVIDDRVAQAGAHNVFTGAQLDWEPEDRVAIIYTPVDGGPTVNKEMIVDAAKWQFKPGDLTMRATLREDVE